MEKADPGIDFQCPTASGRKFNHNIKNSELGPVPDFLLSKKKENTIAKKTFCFAQLPQNLTLNHDSRLNATHTLKSPNLGSRHLPPSLYQQLPPTDIDEVLTAPLALYEPFTSLGPFFSFRAKHSRHRALHRLVIFSAATTARQRQPS